MRKKWLFLSLIILLLPLLAGGCLRKNAPRKPPLPRTRTEQQQPARTEPVISLFINQTGEKKRIKIEDYIAGVVAAEMDPSWPVEALAAQAILARTFTMENIGADRVKKLHGTDASTKVEEFQAYDASKINANVRKAVNLTRGEVVLYHNKYIHAWFHACDGGESATAEEGLGYNREPTPYVKVVKDNCMAITVPANQHWTTRFSAARVREAVQQVTGHDPGADWDVAIVKTGPSGRAELLKVGRVIASAPAIRLNLGSEAVRSMKLDDFYRTGDIVVFQGKGFGHGVGLCQWGARQLAGTGRSPKEIINYYFRDVTIKKLWK